jgi:polysaccharide biosynthesis protein PslG
MLWTLESETEMKKYTSIQAEKHFAPDRRYRSAARRLSFNDRTKRDPQRIRMRRILLLALCAAALTGCRRPASRAGRPGAEPSADSSFTKPISFAILEDYDKGESLSEVAQDFALFRELGVPVWRGSLGWDDYEPEPGRFDFRWLEQFAALADSTGISLRPYLGYTPRWAGRPGKDDQAWNDPPRDLKQWRRFVRAIAGALAPHPSIKSYEIYNEENVPLWWDGTLEDYTAVLNAGAEAVRGADPDAEVLLGGMVWPDLEWLDGACTDRNAPFDVLPFHAYPETWTPESVTVETYLGSDFGGEFLDPADQQCGLKPIWINETGFATTPGRTERQQADWWVRAFATFLSARRVEHLGIYEIKDQRQDTPVIGDAPNYYLGLLRADRSPKLAFHTVKFLVRLFGTDSITVADGDIAVHARDAAPGKVYHHLFIRPDGRQLIFVWARGSSPTVDLRLARSGRRVASYSLDGKRTDWREFDGQVIQGVKLTPGEARVFEVQ